MQVDTSLLPPEMPLDANSCFYFSSATSAIPYVFILSDYRTLNNGNLGYGKRYSTVMYQNALYPVKVESNPSTGYSTAYCFPLSTLKADKWTEFAFPLVSIVITSCIFILIYKAIIKRLMP